MKQKYFTLKDTAKILGIKPRTLRAWVKAGKMPSHKYPGTNRYYFTKKEIGAIDNANKD